MENPAQGGGYLVIRNLYKAFGDFYALKDISLDINQGEFVCFLGPSGCGKTTLLRAIAGLDIQTTGRVYQGGRDISALPPSERDFGIVFQSYALFPHLSAAENIVFGLKVRHVPQAEREQRLAKVASLVGLSEQLGRKPWQLSGGQRQRLSLARTLLKDPPILVLDEATSSIDTDTELLIRDALRVLMAGRTSIAIAHRLSTIQDMDKILVLHKGVLRESGSHQALLAMRGIYHKLYQLQYKDQDFDAGDRRPKTGEGGAPGAAGIPADATG